MNTKSIGISSGKSFSREVTFLCCVSMLILAGCSMPQYAAYTGAEGYQVAGSQTYEKDGMKFMLPPGWTLKQDFKLDENSTFLKLMANGSTTAVFEREGGAVMLITGLKGMVGGGLNGLDFLQDSTAKSVDDLWPDSEAITVPKELADVPGTLKPAFRKYKGQMIVEGVPVDWNIYAGWKGGMGFNTKYEIVAANPVVAKDAFEDFLYILRTFE